METIEVQVRRVSVVSSKPFDEVIKIIESKVGHSDINTFHKAVLEAATASDLEEVIRQVIGSFGLMEFGRFDSGEVLRKEEDGHAPKIFRLLIGNPLIMKEMVKHVRDAAAYAPITILIDERSDGVHLSYDLMESFLMPYGNDIALTIAKNLDTKIKHLIKSAV